MSLHRLQQIVEKTAKNLYDNETFAAGLLVSKARQLAQNNPYDNTCIGMCQFLAKRAEGRNSFLTRAELKDVYHRLYTNGNKFAEAFASELGTPTQLLMPKRNEMVSDDDLIENAFKAGADPVMKNELDSAFDPQVPLKSYSAETAGRAERVCALELNRQGMAPKVVEVVAGQADVLLCQASWETPKGISRALIPIEIRSGQALLPTIFLSTEGFLELTAGELETHLKKVAGQRLTVNVGGILNLISRVKNGESELKPLTNVEKAVMKLASSKGTPAHYDPHGIIGQELMVEASEVKTPELKVDPDSEEILTHLSSSAGEAELMFGKNAVAQGRGIIINCLKEAGFPTAQVGISGADTGSVCYVAALNHRSAVKIPVKMGRNGVSELPKVMLVNGGLKKLTVANLSAAAANPEPTEVRTRAAASPLYEVKGAELVKIVKEAMAQENYAKAEDALSVLQAGSDQHAFQTAYTAYYQGLTGTGKPEAVASTCSKQLKTAHSQHLICGHTNLPVHKVFQDAHGQCQPLYRQGMDSSFEGGMYLTAKIFGESL